MKKILRRWANRAEFLYDDLMAQSWFHGVLVLLGLLLAVGIVVQLSSTRLPGIPTVLLGAYKNEEHPGGMVIRRDGIAFVSDLGASPLCEPVYVETYYEWFGPGKETLVSCNTRTEGSRAVQRSVCGGSAGTSSLRWAIALNQPHEEDIDIIEVEIRLGGECGAFPGGRSGRTYRVNR